MQRKTFARVLVVTAAAIGLIVWLRRCEPTPANQAGSVRAADAPTATRAIDESPNPRVAATRARATRDALRERILHVLEERSARDAPAAAPASGPVLASPRPPGHLRDRTGVREALMRRLNDDFMPLADECIEHAQERSPGLAGMIAINLETISDEALGAVVNVAEAAPTNEIADRELLECIRESALSLILPPPPASGRDKFMLTLPVEPPRDAGTPR